LRRGVVTPPYERCKALPFAPKPGQFRSLHRAGRRGEGENWPNGPREAGLDHAVPYESGILDYQKPRGSSVQPRMAAPEV